MRRVPFAARGTRVTELRVDPDTVRYYPRTDEISFHHPGHTRAVRRDTHAFLAHSELKDDETTVALSSGGETLLFDVEILRAVMPHVKW